MGLPLRRNRKFKPVKLLRYALGLIESGVLVSSSIPNSIIAVNNSTAAGLSGKAARLPGGRVSIAWAPAMINRPVARNQTRRSTLP